MKSDSYKLDDSWNDLPAEVSWWYPSSSKHFSTRFVSVVPRHSWLVLLEASRARSERTRARRGS